MKARGMYKGKEALGCVLRTGSVTQQRSALCQWCVCHCGVISGFILWLSCPHGASSALEQGLARAQHGGGSVPQPSSGRRLPN